jgi:hypothetical protein
MLMTIWRGVRLNTEMKNNPLRKCTTPNEAVWRNSGSIPQKVQCEFGTARSSVEAATTPSRLLGESGGRQLQSEKSKS